MIDALSIVLPVFGLIAIGLAAAKLGVLTEASEKGIADFAFTFAMPALLFRTMATVKVPDVAPVSLWLAFLSTAASVWVLSTLLTILVLKRPAPDAAPISMAATFGNNVMLGIPLAVAAFGDAALAPAALLLSVQTPLYWLAATLHLQWADRAVGVPLSSVIATMLRDLSRNPVLMAIILGSLWRTTGLGLATPVERTLALLGQAGIPCALIALGMSLARFKIAGQLPTLTMIIVLKIVAMPAVGFVLTKYVFDLPPLALAVALLFMATPTGANAFLFASRYGRAVNSTAAAVTVTTALGVVTTTAVIWLLKSS
ncbi:MAG TPA: AEC family transporter [Hyphomicrobiaceae bacterium]|nr:AEC family transporter [Hyphomicrobiaceae bacterium]